MGTEETGIIALEDDNLGFVINLKPLHHVGQAILEVLPPKINLRIWVGESDFEHTRVLGDLQTPVFREFDCQCCRYCRRC